MALEASHDHNQFPLPQQIITNNREFVQIDQANLNNSVQMGCACANPFVTTMENPWVGLNHQFSGMNNVMNIQPQINSIKVESGLCNNLPRKRSRDSMENQFNIPQNTSNGRFQASLPPHHSGIDYILSQFNKGLNMELETQHDREVKFMLATITSTFVKKLKIGNDQLSKMRKLNMALGERMKSLYAETTLWRERALTSEATAMSLRQDFDTILGKVSKLNGLLPVNARVVVDEDEAESCYGSSDSGQGTAEVVGGGNRNMCKKCWERESVVLLLPCRHLCLCSVCGSTLLDTCPVCNSDMTTTVHVNLT